MTNNLQGFSMPNLDGIGDLVDDVKIISAAMKRVSEQGFPVNVRIDATTIVLLAIAIIIASGLSGALAAYLGSQFKK